MSDAVAVEAFVALVFALAAALGLGYVIGSARTSAAPSGASTCGHCGSVIAAGMFHECGPTASACSSNHDYEQVRSPDGGYLYRVFCRACGDTKESIK